LIVSRTSVAAGEFAARETLRKSAQRHGRCDEKGGEQSAGREAVGRGSGSAGAL